MTDHYRLITVLQLLGTASVLPLAILVLAVNLLGDWLRDALNPKLR